MDAFIPLANNLDADIPAFTGLQYVLTEYRYHGAIAYAVRTLITFGYTVSGQVTPPQTFLTSKLHVYILTEISTVSISMACSKSE